MKTVVTKIYLSLACALALVFSVSAQEKGDMAFGAHFAYGTGQSYNNMGLGALLQYHVSNPIRVEPSLTFYFPKDHVTILDVSLNAHYVVPIHEEFNVYPVAGVGVFSSRFSYDGDSYGNTDFGINVGAGAEYIIDNSFKIKVEPKYAIINDWNRFVLTAGITFLF
ncbi:hypothetical protein AGMMS49574_29800 [Bacteroidia bacterium]|nr:hypothetical protein AGMMS49574_29800 [Bacteroidia bacterium]